VAGDEVEELDALETEALREGGELLAEKVKMFAA
jgi:hypothetical protein